LFLLLAVLIALAAFFSSAETGMMSLNRYRLKHLVSNGNRSARRASWLLKRPDRLLGFILIGNTLVNIFAASIATVIGLRLLGDSGLAVTVSGILLTLLLLIFGELTPKTIAALYPERIAFPLSHILKPLLRLFYPLVLLVNGITNNLLRLVGINPAKRPEEPLSQAELRTIVNEAGQLIPERHQGMLLSILDLEQMTVEDVMVPRTEMLGIDLGDDDASLLEQLRACKFTRLPVYREDINNIVGILHLRAGARLLNAAGAFDRDALMREIKPPYFVPEGTPLHTQLFNFQKEKRRVAVVVDEYGAIQGLVTLEDILEEIVGEFTSNLTNSSDEIVAEADGSYTIDGGTVIREINRALEWNLPTDGPKTLNGLLLEHLEAFPDGAVGLRVGNYTFETLEAQGKVLKKVRAFGASAPEHDDEDQ